MYLIVKTFCFLDLKLKFIGLHGVRSSPMFDDVLQGYAPELNYTINGTSYNIGYYLTDGICDSGPIEEVSIGRFPWLK